MQQVICAVLALQQSIKTIFEPLISTPTQLFHVILTFLITFVVALNVSLKRKSTVSKSCPCTSSNETAPGLRKVDSDQSDRSDNTDPIDRGEKLSSCSSSSNDGSLLRIRFLPVFWLLRCSEWLQGPYFYEVYASKEINGTPVSAELVSKIFLVGFLSTAVFGPFVGRLSDNYGRKRGTLAFAILSALGACSIRSTELTHLVLGRMMGGIASSLLCSTPEAWLVGEAQRQDMMEHLEGTFTSAYAGDSAVAIMAGYVAGAVASRRGPNGAFDLSIICLVLAVTMTLILWDENVATKYNRALDACRDDSGKLESFKDQTAKEDTTVSIRDAIELIKSDRRILLVGTVQCLFEAAMYIFVVHWPPAVHSAVTASYGSNNDGGTPYGSIFSCLMACCLVGSTIAGKLHKHHGRFIPEEIRTRFVLVFATFAMSVAVAALYTGNSLFVLLSAFFLFEVCVGFYFPCIGTLRSKYVPDSHRAVIISLFGIPLNMLVVSVFLYSPLIGIQGALTVAAMSLAAATVCTFRMVQMSQERKLS